jgi:hypothetical protein
MATEINYAPVCRKLEDLIKQKLRDEGLVDTGKLLESIRVEFRDGAFIVYGEDYFKYLDDEHGISKSIYESDEFIIFMEDFMIKQIEIKI